MVEHQQPEPGEQTSKLSQAETIELLRRTIQQLEEIVNKLSTRPDSERPPSITFLVESTESLAASLEQEVVSAPASPDEGLTESEALEAPETLESETQKPETKGDPAPVPPSLGQPESEAVTAEPQPVAQEPLIDRALPNAERLDRWDQFLDNVRALLPTSLTQRLSYWGLTGILAGAVIAILLSSVLLFPRTQPTVDEVPAADIKTPPVLKAPSAEQPLETLPPLEPELKLTPEQGLIAAIQAQVDQITSQYAQGLIQTIEANFADSRLTVQVGDDWYALENARQDQLANEMLRRSQELDFRKLEIIDPQNTLIARSPVVGSEMVVLNRGE